MSGGATGQRPRAAVLIVAAGSGERLGAGGPKALVELAGRPLFEWSLISCAAAESAAALVVAAPPGREREFAAVAERYGALVVPGGAVRSASVAAALAQIEDATELVAVHDAARPLAGPELLDAVVEALAARPDLSGAIPAAPVTDTIKRSVPADPVAAVTPSAPGGGSVARRPGAAALVPVAETLDRGGLWAVQTPQAFRAAALREALARPELLATATDDAMLIESAGGRVAILPWEGPNLKVTRPADLELARWYLGRGPGTGSNRRGAGDDLS